MTDVRLVRNVWSGAAATLVAAALVAIVTVLSGPYSSTDSKVFYTLGAALLGASTFFAALTLLERDAPFLGLATAVVAPIGFVVLTYAIWEGAVDRSNAETAFWTGTLALVTALLAATARLLARAQLVRWIAGAAGAFAVLAALVSLNAAVSNDQFWRVGTAITSLWIVATVLYFLVPVLERAITRSDLWLGPAAVLVGAAFVGVVAVGRGEFSPQGYSIFFTLIAAVLTTSALLGGVVGLERGAPVFGWTAVVVSPFAFVMLADAIWRESDDRYRWLATGVVLAVALLVGLSGRLFAVTRTFIRLAGAAGVLTAAAAAVSIEGIWRDDRFFLLEKSTTVLWIVATLCSLLVPVLERYRTEIGSEAGAPA